MAVKLIYFVRHGESEQNASGIRQGSGGPLTTKGIEQVLATAKRFPKKRGRPQIIISSPFERTKETANIIAKELNLKVEYSDLLVERKNPSEIIGRSGEEEQVKSIVNRIDMSFHDDSLRYSDEENFTDLKERVKKLLYFISHRKERQIIMVTHGIFLKMIASYVLYGEGLTASLYNTLSYLNQMSNAGMTICQYTSHWFGPDEWKIITWNDLV